jgi:hypothetical protein
LSGSRRAAVLRNDIVCENRCDDDPSILCGGDDSEVLEQSDEGMLVVKSWFAEKEELDG